MTNPQKITFGEMREFGVRDVLIYIAVIIGALITSTARQ